MTSCIISAESWSLAESDNKSNISEWGCQVLEENMGHLCIRCFPTCKESRTPCTLWDGCWSSIYAVGGTVVSCALCKVGISFPCQKNLWACCPGDVERIAHTTDIRWVRKQCEQIDTFADLLRLWKILHKHKILST